MSDVLHHHHRAMLEQESGINPEVVAARGYRTMTIKAELERLGFSRNQCNVPTLLIPIYGPAGDVRLYQTRPDTPRINKSRPVKYETPYGSTMALDVPPAARDKLGDPSTPLFITEGIKKGDALVSHGLCAVAVVGVWNFRGKNEHGGKTALAEWEFIALNDRRVYIVFDSDVMHKREVHAALVRLKAFLEHRKAKVSLIYLPPGDGAAKQGVDDYLAAGHSVNDLLALASPEVKVFDKTDNAERAGPYLIKHGAIAHEKTTRDGTVTAPLCNFTARVVEERERDDGVERALTLVLEGKLATGKPLPQIEVTAPQFAGMNWPVAEWGSHAVVFAGQGAKDHLRTAIQMLSSSAPRLVTYTHFGWRQIEGAHYFLHADGIIGPDGPDGPLSIQVQAPQNLGRFILPEPPTGEALRNAVKASLGVLELAPDAITVPLLAAAYRAVLGDVDFGLHLAGQTGAGKSELAALAQQHFGAGLDARNLPGSWSSTANALEGLAFAGKDVLVTVDDFAPEGSSYDIARYHATAARLFRAQGNNSGRGRMWADGSLRPDKPPRGLVLSTGEDIPKGHSIKARTLILELAPDALDWERLTKAQYLASSGVYAEAMAGFISWLASDITRRTATFKADHMRERDALQQGGHKRTVDIGAQLLATYRTVLTFAAEVGALSDAESFWQRLETGILAALEPQASYQMQSDPVARFSELLAGIFTSGRAHVVDAQTGKEPEEPGRWGWRQKTIGTGDFQRDEWQPQKDSIGWVDGDDLYLEPSSLYAALQGFARDQGDSVPVTERTLYTRLAERGLLASREAPRNTIRKQGLAGATRARVLHILASTIVISGPCGPCGPHAVPDDINDAKRVDHSKTEAVHVVHDAKSGPQANGPQQKSGPQDSTSRTGFGPHGPHGPQNTGVDPRFGEEGEGDDGLSRLIGATEGEL
jgi:hypothetical protein